MRQSLAGRYRPQVFADVIGQEMAATALSRAAASSSPAPAYLLSGTRGVGKTTIARIFAKALNCEAGPGPEPCNKCAQCLHITSGNHIDVCEIDGASNTGVDDVRALRDKLGFMPMEGKFKVFIIDEAHMLSKSAFNALLKTLEEPPKNTVFIFATTEPQRFPATIVSRCQHFVFRHLPEELIFTHLSSILTRENVPFDEAGVRLIAKRASGSARDSLSLLDQVLSVCGGKIDAAEARAALGLAGAEFFDNLFTALASRKLDEIIKLTQHLLRSGADIGFFMRELSAWLRNLFLYSQGGDAILDVLGATRDEAALLKKLGPVFSDAHLHAAWQMTLEAQRGIVQSPEPGAALELLLLNLALLPRLISIGRAEDAVLPEKGEKDAQADRYEPAPVDAGAGLAEGKPAIETPSVQDWAGFKAFCQKLPAEEAPPQELLNSVKAEWANGKLSIGASGSWTWERLQKSRMLLDTALQRYCNGQIPEITYVKLESGSKGAREDYSQKPEVQLCARILDARIIDIEDKA